MRLNQPIGIGLLFMPCLIGLTLAQKKADFDFVKFTLLFLLGSIVMRSAGCVINDFFDREFDAKTKRTKNRPLAAKKISPRSALVLIAILLIFGLAILLQFNLCVIWLGLAAFPLVILYPLSKRFTYFPQVILGLIFNLGCLLAALATLETISADFFILYLALVIWTLIYDTIYAFCDISDDLKSGVKSMAIKFAKQPKIYLNLLSVLMGGILLYLGFYDQFRGGYFALILLAILWQISVIRNCNFRVEKDVIIKERRTNAGPTFWGPLKAFKASLITAVLIASAIILG